jgi:phosphatidyl-N-methylethanolamine N-methyltransferase
VSTWIFPLCRCLVEPRAHLLPLDLASTRCLSDLVQTSGCARLTGPHRCSGLLFYGFKGLQCGVFLAWCFIYGNGAVLPLNGSVLYFSLGAVLIVVGQILNASVFYRLGKVGAFYGERFGYEVPWCRKFPFSWFKHPQYTGALLSIWGFFLVMRFPHDDWYILPALETAYYVLGAYFER